MSIALHGLVLLFVIWIGNRPKAVIEKQAVPIAFIPKGPGPAQAAAPPPPPPPPKAAHKPHPHVEKPVIKTPLVIPKEIPKEKPPEKPPEKAPPPEPDEDDSPDDDNGGQEGGVQGGVKGGVVGGVKGGVVGGVIGGQLGGGGGDVPVFLGDGMTKPVVDLGETSAFHCSTAQQDQHLEGVVLAQCTVTRDGLLRDCKILKHMAGFDDTQVLEYLAHMKWKPAMQGATPLSIKSFTIPLRLKCNS